MSDFDNSNRGAMWLNKNKQSDNHPDFSGSINVAGIEYWLSGWKKRADQSDQAPLVSFSVREKEVQSTAKPAPAAPGKKDDFEDDIPW